MVEVQLGAAEGALQIFRIRGEPVELLVDAMLVGVILKLEARAHAIKKVRVLRRGEARDLRGLLRGRRGLHHERRLGRWRNGRLWISAAGTFGKHSADRLRLSGLGDGAFGG